MDAPTSPLAIVFTDIVESTVMWEWNSTAMAAAMRLHDDLIRSLIRLHDGYEVKHTGDGFMVVFQRPANALKFCLETQTASQRQKWPDELSEARLVRLASDRTITDYRSNNHGQNEEGSQANGLRLRIVAHFGTPLMVWNSVIHRMDYLGPPVNRAARFTTICKGGQIVFSEEFLRETKESEDIISTAAKTRSQDQETSIEVVHDSKSGPAQWKDLFGIDLVIKSCAVWRLKGISAKQTLYLFSSRDTRHKEVSCRDRLQLS